MVIRLPSPIHVEAAYKNACLNLCQPYGEDEMNQIISVRLMLILFFSLMSGHALGTMGVHDRPSNEVVFEKSDVIAIVRTMSGEVIPAAKNGGVRVKAKVLYPIKGTKAGEIIDIFYGASSIGTRYLATLVWDEKLKGYRYYDQTYDFELYEVSLQSGHQIADARGFEGQANPADDSFYLPVCLRNSPGSCQFVFDHLQFMLKRAE